MFYFKCCNTTENSKVALTSSDLPFPVKNYFFANDCISLQMTQNDQIRSQMTPNDLDPKWPIWPLKYISRQEEIIIKIHAFTDVWQDHLMINKDNWLRLDAQGINSVPIVEEEEPKTVDEGWRSNLRSPRSSEVIQRNELCDDLDYQ